MIFYNSLLAKILLFKGYSTVMLFGAVFTKKTALTDRVIRHEKTHQVQYLEVMTVSVMLLLLTDIILVCSGVGEKTVNLMLWLTITVPPFVYYILYGVEWLVSFIHWFFSKRKKSVVEANGKAYRNSAMEMEAKFNENVSGYLLRRKAFAFLKYYGTL